jgi:CheY-like chemotaxis protein
MIMNQLKPILLVEDNPKDVEMTLAAWKRNNLSNEVIVARDGVEALDYLFRRGKFKDREEGQPVAVFLDLKMPRLDGLEVLRQMKENDSVKMVPVVMLTSSREESDLVASYQLGANAYVVKPVGFDQFVSAIGRLGMFWAVLNEPPPATHPGH